VAAPIATAYVELQADLTKLSSQTEKAMAGVTADVKEAARESEAALERIGTDQFTDIGTKAERAGESIENSMQEAARQSNAALDGIGGTVTRIGGLLAGALAAAGIGAGFKLAIEEASNLNESINAVNVTFGANAAGIQALGEAANTSLGLTQGQFNSLAVGFSAFTEKVAGPGGDVVQTMDDLTTRAADFASVMNLDVNEAAAVFQAGLAGEAEGLKRFGINLSETAVQQYALANGIGAASGELTEQEKIQARYGLLMQETSKTAGDFANTQDSLANGMRILKATALETAGSFGTAFLPSLQGVVGELNTLATEMAAPFAELGASIGATIGPLFEAIGPAIGVIVTQAAVVFEDLGTIIGALAPLISPIVQVVGVLATALSGALAAAFTALTPAIELVAEFIDQFAETLGDILFSAIEAITPLLTTLGKIMKDGLAKILPVIMELFEALAPIVLMLAETVGDILVAVLPVVIDLFAALVPVITMVAQILGGVLAVVLPVIAEVFGQLMASIQPLIPVLQDALLRILTALAPIIPALAEAFLSLVVALVPLLAAILPLIPPLAELVALLVEQIGAPVLLAIAEALAYLAQIIAGLAVVVIGFVTDVLTGFVEFINGLLEVPPDVGAIIDDIVAFFSGLPGRAAEALASLASFVGDKITEMATTAIDKVSGWIVDFLVWYSELPGKAASAMGGLAAAIVEKIAQMATDASGKIAEWVTEAVQFYIDLPGKAAEGLANIGTEIAGAFGDAAGAALDAASGLVDDILGYFEDLPGKIMGALSGIGSSVADGLFDAVKRGWNNLVGFLKVNIPVPLAPDITFDIGKYLKLANGAILNSPTMMLGGEAGPEAVIPIGRPRRAMQLMEESGLGQMWDQNRGGETTLVNVENLNMYDGTDADLLAQKVLVAYMARVA
jgi:phage-related protein